MNIHEQSMNHMSVKRKALERARGYITTQDVEVGGRQLHGMTGRWRLLSHAK